MIHINHHFSPANLVDIGDGLVLLGSFEATIKQDASLNWGDDRRSELLVKIDWNADKFTYEIVRMTITAEPQSEPISGTTLRGIPVQAILKACINRALYAKDVQGSIANLRSIHNDVIEEGSSLRLTAQGPKPETLQWVARIYTLAKIKLDPPSQYVAKFFEIPARTASHWIKLARERGHLSI